VPELDARSPGECRWIVVEWIDAPNLATLNGDEYVRSAVEASRLISEIDPGIPLYLDLSGAGFPAVVDDTAAGLDELLSTGRFTGPPLDAATLVREWADRGDVRRAVGGEAVVVHGDLFPEEVLLTNSGVRVLDWQRPLLGPRDIDLAGLLARRGIDPRELVEPAILQLQAFAELHWAVVAIRDILPGLPPQLPDGWATAALRVILDR